VLSFKRQKSQGERRVTHKPIGSDLILSLEECITNRIWPNPLTDKEAFLHVAENLKSMPFELISCILFRAQNAGCQLRG